MSDQQADFQRYLAPTSPHPIGLEVQRAEGPFIWDTDGKRFTDLVSGIAVNNLGHRHPEVIRAIQEQSERYLHVMPYGEFVQEPTLELARLLVSLLPDGLDSCYFVNSGTESIEAAMKLAKRATGRTRLIAAEGAYHGSTHGALSITDNEKKKFHARPLLPDVGFIPFGEESALSAIDSSVAGVIIEPIQGDAGVRIPPKGYLQAVRNRCDETGSLLILDEIQTGMGRTGGLFAFLSSGIVPDVLCTAKALGAGLPMGAFIASRDIMELWTHNPMLGHITTFGGHPLCCAAALAGLRVLTEQGVLDKVESKGRLFEEGLQHSAIVELRRSGLMMALEFENPDIVQRIVHSALDRGIITFWFLSDPQSFRLQPPLNIEDELIIESCRILREVFDEVCGSSD